MNDEIKEIKRPGQILDYVDTKEHLVELFNYIINLQQAVKDTKETADDMLYELNEENERLKLELSGYREAILKDDKLLGLQQRIDKAIEYIEENYFIPTINDLDNKCNLLNILRGKDNE